MLASIGAPDGWEFCQNASRPPLFDVDIFRDGVLEQRIELGCIDDTIHLGRFAPGRLHIAVSHDCHAVGRDLTEPEACVHEPDESRPISCAPLVVELGPCQTQYVALALPLTERCLRR